MTMALYRWGWTTAIATLLLGGAAAAVAASIINAGVLFGTTVACTGVLSVNLRPLAQSLSGARGALVGKVAVDCVRAGVGVLGLFGLGLVLGLVVIPLVALAVMTSPHVLSGLYHWQHRLTTEAAADADSALDSAGSERERSTSFGLYSDAELCAAWRQSYERLLTAATPAEAEAAAMARQELLDELERRNPDALTDWLLAGAELGSDFKSFLDRRAAPEW
ncbi:hypothetical protein [Kribbella deserti]|uniref:Uncharacterized protein n=1 Tax=Kribbella deserti TaxID=1926257 RepID=A0ABV6QF79_9ACTN